MIFSEKFHSRISQRVLRYEALEDRQLLSVSNGTMNELLETEMSEELLFPNENTSTDLSDLDSDALICQSSSELTAALTPVQASVITVTNTDNSGSGSLRQAIASAQAGDTIVFDSQLKGQTITLTSQLGIGKSITIDATTLYTPQTNTNGLVVDAQNLNRLLYIYGENVQILGVNFIRGGVENTDPASPQYGGGILIESGASLSMSSCQLSSCLTTGDFGAGGGIYNLGTLTLTDCILQGNVASGSYGGSGGALYNYAGSTATLTDCYLVNNIATISVLGPAVGGSIYNNGTLTIGTSLFAGNNAYSGGAIYNELEGTLSAKNSAFAANTAQQSGGAFFSNSVLDVTNCTIAGNMAVYGGGIFGTHSQSVLNLTNTIVASNYNVDTTSGNITGTLSSTSSNNMIGGDPSFKEGPIFEVVDNAVVLTNIDTLDLHLTLGSSAVDTGKNSVVATGETDLDGNNRIYNNIVDKGAYELSILDKLETPTITDVTTTDSEITLVWTAIENAAFYTLAYQLEGSVDWITQDFTASTVTFSEVPMGVTYTFKVMAVSQETGVENSDYSAIVTATITEAPSTIVTTAQDVVDPGDGLISLREAITYAGTGNLGTIVTFDSALTGSTLTLSLGQLEISKSLTIDASSLHASQTGLSGITINGNNQSRVFSISGGTSAAPVQLNDLTITGGKINGYGGGIYNTGKLQLINCCVAGNTATRGAGLYSTEAASTLTLVNCTVTGNTATVSGAGVFNNSGISTFYNTIIASNTASSGSDIYRSSGTIRGSNNLSSFSAWTSTSSFVSTNNVLYSSTKPLFVDAATGNYTLADSSQAIDLGNNTYAVYFDGTSISKDLSGKPRIYHEIVDIGAYEFQIMKLTANFTLGYDETGQNVTVTIPETPGAASFTLRYSTDPNIATGTFQTAYWTSAGTKTLTGLDQNTTYYFKMIATANKSGDYINSDWSPIQNITTKTKLATMTGLGLSSTFNQETYETYYQDGGDPRESMNSITVTYKWSKTYANATGYIVQYSTSASFTTVTEIEVAAPGEYTIDALRGNTIYYFRVCAKADPASGYANGDWFSTQLTTRKVVLAAPTITYSSTGSNIKFIFDDVYGARNYSLRYSTNSDMSNYKQYYCASAGRMRTLSGLQENTVYYFQVISSNAVTSSAYTTSGWQDAGSFSTKYDLARPVLTGSATSATSIQLSFAAIPNASYYILQTASNKEFTDSSSTRYESAGTYTFTNLTPNTKYYYKVTAYGEGFYGQSKDSIYKRITTPAANPASSSLLSEAFASDETWELLDLDFDLA